MGEAGRTGARTAPPRTQAGPSQPGLHADFLSVTAISLPQTMKGFLNPPGLALELTNPFTVSQPN